MPTLIELLIKYLRADKKKLTFGVTEYINDVIEIGKIIGLNRTEEDVYEKRSLEIDFLQEAERNIGKKIKFDASRGIMSAITEATLIDITSQYVKFQKKRNNPKKFKYRSIRYLIKYNNFEFIDSKINGIDNIFINNNNLINALKVLKKENVTLMLNTDNNNAIIELNDSKTIPTKKKTNNKMKNTDTTLIELLIKYFKYENKEVKGIEINHNKAKNGIEIKFNNKPSEEIRNFLKSKK